MFTFVFQNDVLLQVLQCMTQCVWYMLISVLLPMQLSFAVFPWFKCLSRNGNQQPGELCALRICYMLCSTQAKSSNPGRWLLRTGCYVLIFHLVLPFLKWRLLMHTAVSIFWTSHNPGSNTAIVIISLYFKCPMVIVSFNLHKRPKQVLLLFKSSKQKLCGYHFLW